MMSKWLTVVLAMVRAYFSTPKKEDLQDELDKLKAKIAAKKVAVENAMLADDMPRYHKFYGEWLQLCKKANRLRKRLKKNRSP